MLSLDYPTSVFLAGYPSRATDELGQDVSRVSDTKVPASLLAREWNGMKM
jgi:hypothetical protein